MDLYDNVPYQMHGWVERKRYYENKYRNKFLKLQLLKNTTNRHSTNSSWVPPEVPQRAQHCNKGISPGLETGMNATILACKEWACPSHLLALRVMNSLDLHFMSPQKCSCWITWHKDLSDLAFSCVCHQLWCHCGFSKHCQTTATWNKLGVAVIQIS